MRTWTLNLKPLKEYVPDEMHVQAFTAEDAILMIAGELGIQPEPCCYTDSAPCESCASAVTQRHRVWQEAWNNGYRANNDGQHLSACPHENARLQEAWKAGWWHSERMRQPASGPED